jgi:four helix bundle protein
MKQNIIAEKSAAFAVRIVNLSRHLKKRKVEAILINQLLRSGTSIAANVQEAIAAFSKKDFSGKISVSLKEARETSYWLNLLFNTKTISESEYRSISKDAEELEKILFSILKKTRSNIENEG